MSGSPPDGDCHGLHVEIAQVGTVQVEWFLSQQRADRLRVREHTCACTYPMFELCTAAGLWFVRRLMDEDAQVGEETAWMSGRAARDLWRQILTGQAR